MNGKMVVNFEAGRTRLGHLNQRLIPAKNIPDVDVLLGHSLCREVLAERWRDKEIHLFRKRACPVAIVLAWVVAQGTIWPAVDLLLGLLIPRKPPLG